MLPAPNCGTITLDPGWRVDREEPFAGGATNFEPGLSRRWVRRLLWLSAPSLACLCCISFASKALAIPALTPVPGAPFAAPEPGHSKLSAFSSGPNLEQRLDNRFTISHIKVRTDGSLSLVVTVPGPGRLDMMETAWNDNLARLALLQPAPHRFVFARAHTQATSAGKLRVVVRPNTRGRLLVHHHAYRVTLRLWVTYTPIGGAHGPMGSMDFISQEPLR